MERSFWTGDLDLGAPPYDTRASRRPHGNRRDDLSSIRPTRGMQYAEEVRNAQTFDDYSALKRDYPEQVTLIGRWGGSRGEFPTGLLGRIVDRDGAMVNVLFKGRGVFRFPKEAVNVEKNLGKASPQTSSGYEPRRPLRRW